MWYVGGITGENAREVHIPLTFLRPGVKYEMALYMDAPTADYDTNPQAYKIIHSETVSTDVINVRMARCGGFGMSLREIL